MASVIGYRSNAPQPIVAKPNAAINKVFNTPDVEARFKALNLVPVGGNRQTLAEPCRRKRDAGARSSKKSGLKPQ